MNRREFLYAAAVGATGFILPIHFATATEAQRMKTLKNLRWQPAWATHLGCIKGCLDYLRVDVSMPWLYGATGHAFIINISKGVCPSGPTAWNTEMLFRLAKNIGYTIESVNGWKGDGDFAERQKAAWEAVRRAVDAGFPCYGWELEIPEYYVIYGYDDTGYYYSGPRCDEGGGPKPWRTLGDTEIGLVEVGVVKPAPPSDDASSVKAALQLAMEHAKSLEKWIHRGYKSGLAGFDLWVESIETGKAGGFGMAYNAVVWNERRQYAVAFLKEAKERLGDAVSGLFDEALTHYREAANHLQVVADAFPFHGQAPEHIKDNARCDKAVAALRAARGAEAAGLKALQKIANVL
jgi:hypothetical protein